MKARKIQSRIQASREFKSKRAKSVSRARLFDLACLRVAQIHQCRIGQDHYQSRLRKTGESSARLHQLDGWPVCPLFTRKERAALALAELLAKPNPDESKLLPHLLSRFQRQLTRGEVVRLVIAIEAMQDWKQWGDLLYA